MKWKRKGGVRRDEAKRDPVRLKRKDRRRDPFLFKRNLGKVKSFFNVRRVVARRGGVARD